MKNLLISFAIIIVFISSVQATVYYVDPNSAGSDNNSGLINAPWLTIQKAASTAQAGDTVYIQPGTYSEKITFNHSGAEDALITFIGIGSVIVEGTAATTVWSGILNLNAKSYIRIQNFTIQNSYWFGIYVEACDHIYLENNKTYNTGASGISVWHSSYIYAGYNIVRKACYQSLTTSNSQECISFSSVSNFEIHHNEVFESGGSTNGGEGIDTKEACSYGKVYNNMVHDLIRLGIYADSWNKILHDVDVYNNRVFNCSEGITISSEDGGTVNNMKVYNNIVYNNHDFGITVSDYVLDGPRNNISIMNNTVYNNGFGDNNAGWGGGIIVYSSNVSNISIFNNIVSSNDAMQISDKSGVATVVVNKNLVYGYRGNNWTNEVKGTNVIEGDPLFVDVDGTDNISGSLDDNLNVTSSSLAINSGTNTNAPSFDFNIYKRPAEGTVDMGAYESNSIPLANRNISSIVSVEQLVQIYPNPSNGEFNVKILKPLNAVEIFDQTGNKIGGYIVSNTNFLKISIDVSGLYLIRVSSESASQTYKAIVY